MGAAETLERTLSGYLPGAPLHPEEQERVRSLRKLNLLDSEPSARFDDLTTLVADVFDAPIALISLVDMNRQWFLSRCGLSMTETPRDVAFCAYAIHEPDILVVENAPMDNRFADNPMVTGEPHIRFYAGAVIRDTNGLPLGTLCLIDHRPRQFCARERRRLVQFMKLAREEMVLSSESHKERIGAQMAARKDPITRAYWNDAFFTQCEETADDEAVDARVAVTVALDNLDFLANAHSRLTADEILVQIANRLYDTCQTYGDFIPGRLDEKRLAINISVNKRRDLDSIAETLRSDLDAILAGGVATSAGLLTPRCSVAVALFDANNETPREIVKLCRAACEKISKDASVRSVIVGAADRFEVSSRFQVAADLAHAIKSDALRLELQPKVDTTNGHVVGAECLLRWKHPQLGNVPPTHIVAAAEDSQRLLELDGWVIRNALAFLSSATRAGHEFGRLSVNISGFTLASANFAKWLKLQLHDYQVAGELLDLEIVESAVIDDFEQTIGIMREISELGVSFSIDDFGTGHSSLAYVRELPIQYLKIDKSFIRDVTKSSKAAALYGGITGLAKSLGVQCVAEGVETPAQLQLMRELGCEQIQGWLFARSMPPSTFIRFLAVPAQVHPG
ncbi:MAG: sensor domain-containing phosphodiesterase [Pseudomonadota bacterium]